MWKPTRGSADISVNCTFTPARRGRKDIPRSADPCRCQFQAHQRRALALRCVLRREPPAASILTSTRCRTAEYALRQPVWPMMRFHRQKAYLEGMTATHSGDHIYRRNNALMGTKKAARPTRRHRIRSFAPIRCRRGRRCTSTANSPPISTVCREEGRGSGFSM
jgi:hypothetical protein